MKHFETPTIEIERFDLIDTITVSLVYGESGPSFTMPEDEFGAVEPAETM